MSEMPNIPQWTILPDSIYLNVFRNLDIISLINASKVCMKWHRISRDSSLIRHLSLTLDSIEDKHINEITDFVDDELISLKMNGKCNTINVKENVNGIIYKLLNGIRLKCPNLTYFHMNHIDNVICLILLPQNVSHLSVCHSQMKLFLITNSSINERLFETIKCLNMSFCSNFESFDCRYLNQFTSLRTLYMEGLYRVNDGGISFFPSYFLSKLIVIDIEGTDVKDEGLQYILQNGQSLRELYLGHTQICGDIDFDKVNATIPLLRICVIDSQMSSTNLRKILFKYKSLKWVNCNNGILSPQQYMCLKSIPKSNNEVTCLHYLSHKCDNYKEEI